jgi:Zn-dependent metalloprotease
MSRHRRRPPDVTRSNSVWCCVVPPHIFSYMAEHADSPAHRDLARRALAIVATMHADREAQGARTNALISDSAMAALPGPAAPVVVHRKTYTANNTVALPGTLVESDGSPASSDVAVQEADAGAQSTADFYSTVFGRSSVDGQGLTLISTVHYNNQYDNAFWNGGQMVYGDGDATIFDRFTKCLDVIGHELTHGVTQYTAHLVYHNQPGALNESISDVFGSMVKQKALNQTAATADWLIGAGLFIPKAGVNRTALRSMKAPGTAYDDPTTIGKDPQPADMAHYVTLPDTQQGDFGGVHINSGIPNKAFYEAAIGFGGSSWEKAGKVWYTALTGGALSSTASFAEFRNLTIAAANTLFGASGAQIVTAAWATVGL